MVFVTGDTHAQFNRFSTKNFPEQKNMTRDDTVIILGDFGGIWHDNKTERHNLDWLNNKSFTLCFVDGNHENYDRLYDIDETLYGKENFEIVDFHGGKARKIRDNIYHLMRGQIYEFDGKDFFCMGGARSHDISDGILDLAKFRSVDDFLRVYNKMQDEGKMFRVNHLSWWKQELPSKQEKDFAEKNLAAHDFVVDYVLTHCLPQQIAKLAGFVERDGLTLFFNKLLREGLTFESWYCGHYHFDNVLADKYHVKYYNIERLL